MNITMISRYHALMAMNGFAGRKNEQLNTDNIILNNGLEILTRFKGK